MIPVVHISGILPVSNTKLNRFFETGSMTIIIFSSTKTLMKDCYAIGLLTSSSDVDLMYFVIKPVKQSNDRVTQDRFIQQCKCSIGQ